MFFFPWMWCLIKYFSMCAIMCEPHKFPRIHRVQLAKRISSISPQSHNKIPPASRNNYYTIPYIHPTQFFLQKKILQDSAFDQARVVKVRYTRSAHDSHPPTKGETTPQRPTAFVVDKDRRRATASAGRLAAFTWGNAWNPGSQWFFIIHDSVCLSSPH